MWLVSALLARLTGNGEPPSSIRTQAIVLAALVALPVVIWLVLRLFFDIDLLAKLTFDRPLLLLLMLLALPIFALGAWSLRQLGPARRWASVYLRVMVLLLLVAMLAGFRTVQTHDELTVVSLIDTSESVRRFFRPPDTPDGRGQDYEQWLASYFKQAGRDKRSDDYWAVQTFDGRPTIRLSPSLGEVTIPLGTVPEPYEGSNVQRAIESAMAAKQRGDSALRIVLVSDGNLDGEVMSAVQAAAAAGVQIDVVPLDYQVKGEVMVQAVRATPEAREGQTVKVSVELRSADKVAGQLQLRHNEQWVDLNGPDREGIGLAIDKRAWRTRLDADDNEVGLYALTKYIDRPISETGVNTYDAVFVPDPDAELANAITANDRGQAFTLVAGQGKVLVVDGVGGQAGRILPLALAERGIDTALAPIAAMPSRLSEMRKYDAILLHNVPAEAVPPAVQRNLARYVHDLGGGFAMIGGPDSFGAGGWTNTDIDKYILPVSCEIPSQKVLPSGALILVIDRSGSMSAPVAGSPHKQQNVAAEAAILALSALYPQDYVGVVSFDSSAKWIVKPQLNKNPQAIADKIRAIGSGGGTDISAGVWAGYNALKDLKAQDAAIKHMIVISDGQGALPNNFQLGGQLANSGITISTVGVGNGHNAAGLSALAQTGNGTFYPVNNPANLPQVFIKEARTIRKNLIKEESFTPRIRPVASPIMVGIDSVPPLKGFVLTGPKKDPRIFTPIVGSEGEPIFAHHQVGLGRAAAFTADATNRWAQDWLGNWPGSSNYADFWARTVRQIARPAASTQADLTTTIDGDKMTIRLDAAGDTAFVTGTDRRASFGNNLAVRGSVVGPDGKTAEVTLEQVGPGVYQTQVPASQAGNYIVDLQMAGGDERRRVIGGASKPSGGELRNFKSNRALLSRIAEMTGGRVLDPMSPADASLYDRQNTLPSTSSRPLRWQLMPFLLALLLMDVACRRIAWEGQEVAAWARGRANAVLGLMQTRQVESGSTMSALKAKRQETSDKLNQNAEPTPLAGLATRAKSQSNGTAAEKNPKPTTSRTRKFVASEEDLAAASEDFSSAVGGAKEGADAKPMVTAAMRKSEKQQDQGPTTSRLLDAKRKAQERLKNKEE